MSQLLIYKPTTAGRRKTSVVDYSSVLTKGVKRSNKLIIRKKNRAGRNNRGVITVRHRGGGYRSLVRLINYKRNAVNGYKVLTIEYDPGRNAFISLAVNLDSGKKEYILAHKGIKEGDILKSDGSIEDGNRIEISKLPIGTEISQLEIYPGKGAQMIRGAGAYGVITANEAGLVSVKLPSGEIRKFQASCTGVIGRMSNENYKNLRFGKAGRMRHMGIRPTVRGKVMNPVDHPHGGGEGSNSIGMAHPKTPWGKNAYGVRTRDKKKASSKLIVKRRKSLR